MHRWNVKGDDIRMVQSAERVLLTPGGQVEFYVGEDVVAVVAAHRWTSVVREPEGEALWFTPDAIREHFAIRDSSWSGVVGVMSDAELTDVGIAALFSDTIAVAFHEALVNALHGEEQ